MAGQQVRLAASRSNSKFDPSSFMDPAGNRKARGDESRCYDDAVRHEEEAAPVEDDFIVIHYLKHHPLYEFKNHEEFHVDNYRHWLHNRVDYYNTETYPAEVNPWELGNPFGHMFFLVMPIIAFGFIGHQYKVHLHEQKNVPMPIVGVFSQIQV